MSQNSQYFPSVVFSKWDIGQMQRTRPVFGQGSRAPSVYPNRENLSLILTLFYWRPWIINDYGSAWRFVLIEQYNEVERLRRERVVAVWDWERSRWLRLCMYRSMSSWDAFLVTLLLVTNNSQLLFASDTVLLFPKYWKYRITLTWSWLPRFLSWGVKLTNSHSLTGYMFYRSSSSATNKLIFNSSPD
jgi:hypothetical protein